MTSLPGRHLAPLLLCAAIALPLRSEEAPPARKSESGSSNRPADKMPLSGPMPFADAKLPDLKKIDFSTLPADALIIVCERVAEALRLVPDAVVLTPKKYQGLLEEIERLKKRLQPDKPQAPSKCHLQGKVEGNVVHLRAQFEGATERANAVVALACPQAWATDARLDGRTPMIRAESDGFQVRIEKAGRYQVTLELIVPLSTRPGNGRGFELTLPRAAINNLELELPANSKDVRAGRRQTGEPLPAGLILKNHRLQGGLGPGAVGELVLTWKEARPPSGVPVRTAEGNILVQLDSAGLAATANLLLKIEGGQTDVWHLLTPLAAKIEIAEGDEARVRSIEKADRRFASLRTIRLKEPSADPLGLRITVQAPVPAKGKLAPIGPFFVVGAIRQSGLLQVRNRIKSLHPDYHPHGTWKRRAGPEEPGGDAAATAEFTYSNIPMVDKPRGVSGPASLSWMDLEIDTVRGQVRTRVSHHLTLRPDAAGRSANADIVSSIAPVSKWSDIEQLKIVVPEDWTPLDDEAIESEKATRFVAFRLPALVREGPSHPVRLRGRYGKPLPREGRAVWKLPSPRGLVEQCEVTIQAPPGSEVILHNAEAMGLEWVKQSPPHEQTWRCRNSPPDGLTLDVSWRPYRPELQIRSVVDVTLHGGRGEVRHEMQLHSPRSLPASIGLRVPGGVTSGEWRGAKEERGTLTAPQTTIATGGGSDFRLLLQYSIALAEARPLQFAVPLVVAEQATSGQTKVRVWCEPGRLPRPANGTLWEERNIEVVKERSQLPVLVLQSPRFDAPLVLRGGEEQAAVYTILAERGLACVRLRENGEQIYRVRFLLRQLAGRHLDIELPAPTALLHLQVALNHKRIAPDIVDESGRQTEGGSIARLRLDGELVGEAALLELRYQLPPGRSGGNPLRTTLRPPRLRHAPPMPLCWQVMVPENRVLLAPESASGMERSWGWRGRLWAAHLSRGSGELEREFEEALPPSLRRDRERSADESAAWPALVRWQDASEAMVLTHAPRQAWLLLCSLSLFFFGLALYAAARAPMAGSGATAWWLWPILALGILGCVAAALFWPTPLWAIVYGCEPGACVLGCVLVVQGLLQRRYRRRIVYLPSFSRSKPRSSVLRPSAAPRRPHAEPSTVDAPPPSNVV